MSGSYWVVLHLYGSHEVRHVDFRGLTVVNGHPGTGASHTLHHIFISHSSLFIF